MRLSLARRPWVASMTTLGSRPSSTAFLVHAASTAAMESVRVPSLERMISFGEALKSGTHTMSKRTPSALKVATLAKVEGDIALRLLNNYWLNAATCTALRNDCLFGKQRVHGIYVTMPYILFSSFWCVKLTHVSGLRLEKGPRVGIRDPVFRNSSEASTLFFSAVVGSFLQSGLHSSSPGNGATAITGHLASAFSITLISRSMHTFPSRLHRGRTFLPEPMGPDLIVCQFSEA